MPLGPRVGFFLFFFLVIRHIRVLNVSQIFAANNTLFRFWFVKAKTANLHLMEFSRGEGGRNVFSFSIFLSLSVGNFAGCVGVKLFKNGCLL